MRWRGCRGTDGSVPKGTGGRRLRRWTSALAAGALAVGGAVVATTAAVVVAPPAQAQPFECDTLFALQGQSPHNIYTVDVDSGDLTSFHQMDLGGGSSANNNAFGISVDGQFAFTHREPNVYMFDSSDDSTTEFPGVDNLNATHGAVDPATGIYYFGNIDEGDDEAQVFAFDPASEEFLGQVAVIELPGAPGGNGDWAFDSSGNMYLTSGSSGGNNGIYVARGPLPTTDPPGAPTQFTARQITQASTPDPINGVAVDVEGFFYLSSSDNLFQVNPTSGAVTNVETLDPDDVSVDLASCATPSTLMVQKDVENRADPTDQFTVSVTGGDIVDGSGNTGTTTGADDGVQDETGEYGGPLMVLAGDTTYTITEEAAGTTDLADYTTTWECVNQTDDTVIASGDGLEGEVTVPVADPGELAASVVCTFTNTALQPGLEITKTASPDDEVLPGDTVDYEITVENTGETTYTADDPATLDDDLSDVIDDATFNDDAAATAGEVSYTEPTLSWSSGDADFAPGDTATITYSVTVNDPPTGDGDLTNAVVGPPESNCLDGTEPDCSVPIPVRRLEIVKTASPIVVAAGGTVTYTVEVTNTGQAPYTALDPATFSDDLTEVLDDATWDDNATASTGTVTFVSPTLSWSGALAPGETATITYTVTVNDPVTGDGELTNSVVGPDESNCPDGSTDPDCSRNVPVRSLEIEKTVDVTEAEPGDVVTYTVEVTNTGQFPFPAIAPASFDDDLTDVLDDATYNDDGDADVGEVTFDDPTLHWEGPLAIGETATVTYSMTVDDPVTGDGELVNSVVGPPVSNCDEGTEPECSTVVPIRALLIEKTAAPPVTAPGGTVEYAIEVTNTGTVPYTVDDPATLTDDLSAVLDDATFNNDEAADTGAVTFTSPTLSWTSSPDGLAPGETATITYSVTVDDPDEGDGELTNTVVGPDESNCEDGSTDPDCSANVPVRELLIEKTVDVEEAEPGDVVTYTVEVTNTGQFPFGTVFPARFDDDMTEVLDDATYNDDGDADIGEVTFDDPTLHWESPLGVGETATITYSVTVDDPPTGDGTLTNSVVGPPVSNCDEGTEPECSTDVLVRALEIVKTSEPPGVVLPGEPVSYTIEVTNTGQAPYTVDDPATFDDDLTGVLDDADYNDDATADIGEVSYAEPTLSWSGPLEPGQTATITYSVTTHDPPDGDGVLANSVVGPDESNCEDGSTDPDCDNEVRVRALEILKTATPDEAVAGGTVTYTVTVTNVGQVDYPLDDPATFDDDLTEVLDDADYNGDASADIGTVDDSGVPPTLSWSGPLDVGETATITYSVTVHDPPDGDGTLDNSVVGPEESNCDTGDEDDCHVPIPVRALLIEKTAVPDDEVTPGGTVTYAVTVENTGQVPYTALDPATFDDDLSEVLDDAIYNDDAAATTGTVTFDDPTLSWSGALAPGETATITYSVTVNDPVSGDGRLDNAVVGPDESNCDTGDEVDCHVPVPVRALDIRKTSRPIAVLPGGTVAYTVRVTNAGQVPYTALDPATFDDDMSDVLDDAAYNNDAEATSGTVTFVSPTLSWSGALAPGATATITYSVTVNDPPTGDGDLVNAVVGPDESNCDEGTEPRCNTFVPIRELEIVKTASAEEAEPGDTVSYTIEVTNTGTFPFGPNFPARFDDDLTEVLDDAIFNDDAEASTGEVTYDEPVLHWEGTLGVGDTATITYSVTVNDPTTGDDELANVVTGPPVSNCDPSLEGFPAEECRAVVPVKEMEVVKTSEPRRRVRAGGTVSYTVTVTNTGQVPYTDAEPATFTDDMSDVLDDARFNDDAEATVGVVTFADPTLSWSGPLAVGDVATVTYSVTVDDPLTGDGELLNAVVGPDESNCDPGAADPAHAVSWADRAAPAATAADCRNVVPAVEPPDEPFQPPDEPPGGDLPDTGSGVGQLVVLLALLLVTAGGTLLWARRRML